MRLQKFESPSFREKNSAAHPIVRRRGFRSGCLGGGTLALEYRGRVIDARVVDSSERGFGVEIPEPLALDTELTFTGVGLQGRATVAHCAEIDDGLFRAGLDLKHARFSPLGVLAPSDLAEFAHPHGDTGDGAVSGPGTYSPLEQLFQQTSVELL